MFCRNCGKEMAQNADVCLSCGFRPSNGNKFCNNCGVETNPNQEVCIRCGVRLAHSGTSVDEGKLWCILAYLGILCFIPLLTQKQNRFIIFHAKQGLVLFITWMIAWILKIFVSFIPYIGPIMSVVLSLVVLGCFVIGIIGIVQAIQGKEWKIPILGDFAEKLNF
ncbi:MAG: DUF4870 domain-containing protein [Syntrophobacterales bacterium]|jgi:uncharacterized membrane protein|nr:DUF4870 domain-containing protein [Syntrophobacterales bacterium]